MTEPEIHILKTTTCKSVSGKSTLTYQIGTLPDSSLHLRIDKNSGNGQFSREWISLEVIRTALEKVPAGSRVTSYYLEPLFKGKSANNPSFLMAGLSHLGLLRPLKGKQRGHELLDPTEFDARMDKLTSAKPKTGSATRKQTTKKAQIKKKAVARRKTAKAL
jgi:hypothetical protein